MATEEPLDEDYHPLSDFLCMVAGYDVPLTGSAFADDNLRRLIALTVDDDFSNRDWAVFLLAREAIGKPEVRDALLHAAKTEDGIIRAQAVLGLAQITPELALPYVQNGLKEPGVFFDIIEAAEAIGDPSFIDDLIRLAEPAGDDFCESLARSALVECQRVAHAIRLNQSG